MNDIRDESMERCSECDNYWHKLYGTPNDSEYDTPDIPALLKRIDDLEKQRDLDMQYIKQCSEEYGALKDKFEAVNKEMLEYRKLLDFLYNNKRK